MLPCANTLRPSGSWASTSTQLGPLFLGVKVNLSSKDGSWSWASQTKRAPLRFTLPPACSEAVTGEPTVAVAGILIFALTAFQGLPLIAVDPARYDSAARLRAELRTTNSVLTFQTSPQRS